MQLVPLGPWDSEFPRCGLFLDYELICSAEAEGSQIDGLGMPFPALLEGGPVDLLAELHL